MAVKPSLPAAVFAKALRSLETGGLSHHGVVAEIKELLAAGASAAELREVLLSRDSIEPLSVQARAEMLALLNGAMLRERQRAAASAEKPATAQETAADLKDGSATPPESPAAPDPVIPSTESSTIARVAALEAALAAARSALQSERSTTRDAARTAAKAAADTLASLDTARAQAAQAAADAQHFKTEAQTLHDSLGVRDASLAQVRQTLVKREAQLAAVSKEHADLSSVLEMRTKSVTQLQSDLQAVRAREAAAAANLAKTAAALESEQTRAQANSKSLVEKLVSTETALQAQQQQRVQLESDLQAARANAHEGSKSSARFQTEAETLRNTLATHEAALAALQREQAEQAADLEPQVDRTAEFEADLQAARARAEAALADSARYQADARTLRDTVAAQEANLAALQREYDKQGTSLETHERYGAQLEAELEKARARVEAREEKSYARQQTTHAFDNRAELDPPPPAVETAPTITPVWQSSTAKLASAPAKTPAPAPKIAPVVDIKEKPAAGKVSAVPATRLPWKMPASPRALGIAAAVILVAVAVWTLSHRTHAPVEATVPVPPVETQKAGSIIRDCPTCPAMTVLPAGRFKQGTPGVSGSVPSFEQPQHWVVIGKPFALSTTAVTVDEFSQFVASNGREVQGCDTYDGAWKHRPERNWKDPGFSQTGEHPVTCVSSNDAAAYAAWLSTQTGHKYRLPSASEWEYAARAGGESVQPWGAIAADACRYANVADQSAADQYPGWQIFGCDDAYVNTSPVGSFEPNAFGLKDMMGNVFQWTEDCWNADYTGAPVNGSARSDGDCGQRELRGGSWFSAPDVVRANYRNHFAADYRASSIGIRVVRELNP